MLANRSLCQPISRRAATEMSSVRMTSVTAMLNSTPRLQRYNASKTPGFAALSTAPAAIRRAARASRPSVSVQAFSSYKPYPFHESEYQRVGLVRRDPYGPLKILPTQNGPCSGVLVFGQAGQPVANHSDVMEVFVAGDAAGNIYAALHGQANERPMAHDLLLEVLTRASQVNRRELTLLKVAVVELKEEVFVGRLFFGDPATQQVLWDCDCRPSDGCFLHIKTGCPFYVASSVWRTAAVPLLQSKVHLLVMAELEAQEAAAEMAQGGTASSLVQQHPNEHSQPQHSHHHQTGQGHSNGHGLGPGSASSHGQQAHANDTTRQGQEGGGQGQVAAPVLLTPEQAMELRAEDPEPIKLLKRKLQVALSEEDYRAAVSFRDHPFLDLYRKAHSARYFGRQGEASEYEAQLVMMLRAVDPVSAVGSGDAME